MNGQEEPKIPHKTEDVQTILKETEVNNTSKTVDSSQKTLESSQAETKSQTTDHVNGDILSNSSVPNTPELSNSQMTPCSSRGGSPSPSTKDSLSEISEDSDSELSEASIGGSASSDESDAEKMSVTDGSDSSDDDNVKSLKRLHRDGMKRLIELNQEFETLKSRLMESKIEDLENEKKEILDGEHPEYREQQAQLEERLRKRRKVAEIRKEYRSFDIQNQYDGAKKQATDTLIAEKAILRQSFMDLIQRKKRLLQKEFNALEEQREESKVYGGVFVNHSSADPAPSGLKRLEAQQDLSVMRISSLLNTENEDDMSQANSYSDQERSQDMFVSFVKSRNLESYPCSSSQT
ncbi:hypothetical protein K7432_002620 [Basidiobolus ranarum]|uniref:Uncharacterized protein n=1 Tax=Basidiobolus ranarum TaxID=34480 RepID=A0ABR2X167_9FUNG